MVTHYYVDHIYGNNANNGLSWGEAKFTIGAVVSIMTGSDIVHCRNGTAGHEFTERVSLTSNSFLGTEADPTTFITEDQSIIDARDIERYCFYFYNPSWIKVKGFTVKNARNVNITYLNNCTHGIVEDVISQGSGFGIECDGSSKFEKVTGCLISGASTGGLWAYSSAYSEIAHNIVSGMPYGIYCYGESMNVHDNVVYNCTTRGFYLYQASDIEFTRNYAHHNAIGLYVASASGHIHFNDIYDNTINAQDNGGAGSLNWSKNNIGNYWGYGGLAYDSNNDGIGDDPYDIPGTAGSQDGYPLMCSFTIWPSCPYLGVPKKKWALGRVGVRFVKL